MLRYCGAALSALVCILILRTQKNEFSTLVAIGASVMLLGAAVVTLFPVLEFVRDTVESTGFSKYFSTLMKALGITLTTELCSSVCRDAGEGALGAKLELVGKAEILLLCLPLIGELVALAADMVGV